jgi:hypothetical protein
LSCWNPSSRAVVPSFQMAACGGKSVFEITVEIIRLGENTFNQKRPSNKKAGRLGREGRKTGNRGRYHVHAPSTCCASCGLGNCVVRHRRVDRPCGIHACKVILERTAASDIRVPVNSRHGFWKGRGNTRRFAQRSFCRTLLESMFGASSAADEAWSPHIHFQGVHRNSAGIRVHCARRLRPRS